jgi:predicted nuclease of predicted toxin-antitoxin system
VKLLFDENLSRKLVVRPIELYPKSAHMADFDLLQRPDGDIWTFARANGFVVVRSGFDQPPHIGRIRLVGCDRHHQGRHMAVIGRVRCCPPYPPGADRCLFSAAFE